MKLQRSSFFSIAFAFVALTSSACVDQKTSSASSPSSALAEGAMTEDIDVYDAKKVIEKTPDSAEGYNKLAIVYIRKARETGDFSINTNAQTAVNRALEIEPQNYNAQKLKASLLLTFHRFEEGLNFAKQLQQDHPQDYSVYGFMTDANVELGNYPEAVEAVQKMVDLRPAMEAYARVSYVRSLYGDTAGAIEAMGIAARSVDPREKEAQAWCLVHLGDEHFKAGQFAEAEKQYDFALQAFPNYHFALAGKAHARAAAGDFENAVKLFTQAQDKIPLTDTVISLGDIYTKLGKAEEAKKQYDLAEFIEQKLGDASDRRRLALLWADHDIKSDEALDIATREHERRKDIFTADILAWNLYKKGDFGAAKKISAEAMRLKTKDARIFYHTGMIEKGLGNKKAAAEFLQKALKTNPSFDILQAENARRALQEIK